MVNATSEGLAILFVSSTEDVNLKSDPAVLGLYNSLGSIYAIQAAPHSRKAMVLYNVITAASVPSKVQVVASSPPSMLSLMRPPIQMVSQLQEYTGLSKADLSMLVESYLKWSVGQAMTPQEKMEIAKKCAAAAPEVGDTMQRRHERIAAVLDKLTVGLKIGIAGAAALDEQIPRIAETLRTHIDCLPEGVNALLKKIEDTPLADLMKDVEISALMAIATSAVGFAEIVDALGTIVRFRSIYSDAVKRAEADLVEALTGIIMGYRRAQVALEEQKWGAFSTDLQMVLIRVQAGKDIADGHVRTISGILTRAERAQAAERKKAISNGVMSAVMGGLSLTADSKQEFWSNALSCVVTGAAGMTQLAAAVQLEKLSRNLRAVGDVCSRISTELAAQHTTGSGFYNVVAGYVEERKENELLAVRERIRPFLTNSIKTLETLTMELQQSANASTLPDFATIQSVVCSLVPQKWQRQDQQAADEVYH